MKWRIIQQNRNYEVSDTGLVRRRTPSQGTTPHRILKQSMDKYGYPTVILCMNGGSKKFLVHRLVAAAFLSNDNNLPTINHKDGNKQNNLITNLEWCTYRQNIMHAFETGLNSVDKQHRKKPIRCKETGIEYESIISAAKQLGITGQSLSCHLKGRSKICCGFHFEYC